jgi:hypothetical protein
MASTENTLSMVRIFCFVPFFAAITVMGGCKNSDPLVGTWALSPLDRPQTGTATFAADGTTTRDLRFKDGSLHFAGHYTLTGQDLNSTWDAFDGKGLNPKVTRTLQGLKHEHVRLTFDTPDSIMLNDDGNLYRLKRL